MKSLEDIIIDIAKWVKKHGPIKRKFPPSPFRYCQYNKELECHCFDFVDGTVKYIECPEMSHIGERMMSKPPYSVGGVDQII